MEEKEKLPGETRGEVVSVRGCSYSGILAARIP
jgi:hypothetical protein